MKHLIAAVIILLTACGSSPSESKTIKDGNWSGTASDSTDITFTVDGNTIKNMNFTVEFQMESAPDTTVTWNFNTDITDNEFQYMDISGENEWQLGVNMTGTFDPPDQVSGDLTTWIVYSEGGTETDTLETSWSATPE